MTTTQHRYRLNGYWTRYVTDDDPDAPTRLPPGQDLAALRRGTDRTPGTVPSMWEFHRAPVDDRMLRSPADSWQMPPLFTAEHHALVLFGHHQQSQKTLVHLPGVGVGEAVRALRARSDRPKAVDARFYAMVAANSADALAAHLRRIIGRLRALSPTQGLDYEQLVDDLRSWHFPDGRDRVRRRWGLQYQIGPTTRKDDQ